MDSRIIKNIKALRQVQPNSSWLSSQRSFLLSEISRSQKKEKRQSSLVLPLFNFNILKILRPNFAIALVIIILVSSLATIGAISAAQNSLPGDSLYPLKTAFEQTQLTFSPGEANKTKLSIKFATQRIEEFSQLANNKPESKKDIQKTVKKFTAQLISVQESIDRLKEKNAEKAAEVARLVKAQASLYEETLIKTSEKLAYVFPGEKEELKKDINQALIEVNKTEAMSEEVMSEEVISSQEGQGDQGDKETKDTETIKETGEMEETLVPAEEEKIESPSVQFEDIQPSTESVEEVE